MHLRPLTALLLAANAAAADNPYHKGCLHALDPAKYKMRVCNREDPPAVHGVNCTPPLFPAEYPEIRLFNSNWGSSMFFAWIVQIMMSELMQIPVSIETAKEASFNFYDKGSSFAYAAHGYTANLLFFFVYELGVVSGIR